MIAFSGHATSLVIRAAAFIIHRIALIGHWLAINRLSARIVVDRIPLRCRGIPLLAPSAELNRQPIGLNDLEIAFIVRPTAFSNLWTAVIADEARQSYSRPSRLRFRHAERLQRIP